MVFALIIIVCVIMGMPVKCKNLKVHRDASRILKNPEAERKINPHPLLGNLNWVYGQLLNFLLVGGATVLSRTGSGNKI